ncbi:MAG: hypothetical protein A2046_03085 [Bacteroidetes bacterium GWA2_30_7]|nr:MAG: hypothetical protein A2046_03085 [Bacteroidetes bacterium GWA2_30_7]
MKPTLLLLIILFAICGFGYKAFTQVVNIPDYHFKAALVGNSSINTNGDGEIQTSEAAAYSGTLNLSYKNISDLTGIEAFTAITKLYCDDNQLTSLNVSANTSLTGFLCYYNQLTSLNVSANTALNYLNCGYNQITSLNVSANTALTVLICSDNQLTTFNVSSNTVLTEFYCNKNQLTSLNVSANTALTKLFCNDNQLTSLDVKNGNNSNFSYFYAENNPNLNCINVDDSIWSTANWFDIDAGAYFSENCYTGIPSLTNTTEIKIYPNPASEQLTVYSSLRDPRQSPQTSTSLRGTKQSPQLVIFDLFGKEVLSTEITENEQSINISKLVSGLYTIKIITEKEIIVKKMLKQ